MSWPLACELAAWRVAWLGSWRVWLGLFGFVDEDPKPVLLGWEPDGLDGVEGLDVVMVPERSIAMDVGARGHRPCATGWMPWSRGGTRGKTTVETPVRSAAARHRRADRDPGTRDHGPASRPPARPQAPARAGAREGGPGDPDVDRSEERRVGKECG